MFVLLFSEYVNCFKIILLTLALVWLSSVYMAPELIRGSTLSKGADIYSLGISIVEIVTGHRKYHEGTSNEDFTEVRDFVSEGSL
jgi:serine/threonine protein kinase